jgi:hypothetical protein
LIKVAEEAIIDNGEDDLSADKLKNAAATKKLAIFDAFEILNRIQEEEKLLVEGEKENEEILQQIREDTNFEITDITRKNEYNKSHVNDLSLKSKAELQLTNNKLQDIETDIDQLQRQI